MYECIVSKKMNVIKQCIPSILLGYVLAVVIGTGANSFGKYEASYEPDDSKLSYVSIETLDNYVSSDNEYFKAISSKVKFTDDEILKYVSEKFVSYKEKCISNGVHNYTRTGRGSVTSYKIGFRQNGVTHYRKVTLTDSDAQKLAGLLKKDENFVKLYMNLPDSDKVTITGLTGDFEDSDTKEIYKTITSEVKEIGFEKWYQIVNSSDSGAFLMAAQFSKAGVPYELILPISKNMPKSYNKYISARNAYAIKNNEKELARMSEILKMYAAGDKPYQNQSEIVEDLSLVIVYNDESIWRSPSSYINTDSEKAQKVLKALAESIDKKDFNKEVNADNPVVVINYSNYSQLKDGTGDYIGADAIIQLDGYTQLLDYVSDVDEY